MRLTHKHTHLTLALLALFVIFCTLSASAAEPACVLTCPADISATNTPGQCGTVVNYPAPNTTGACGTVTCTPPSGSFFKVGASPVTCSSSAGPTCSFTVIVNDKTPPQIDCPASFAVTTTGSSRVVNYQQPNVNDNCPEGFPSICAPASGSVFPVGVTKVNCSVQDGAEITSTCSFSITVNRVTHTLAGSASCAGTGTVVTGTFTIGNNGAAPAAVAATVALPGGLAAIPGACSANVGSCSVVNAATIAYSATLAPGQTATVRYQAQVGDLVTTGATLCSNLTVSFGGGSPQTTQACVTTNCPPVGPGQPFPGASEINDQTAGSVLIYNLYTSNPASTNTQNTRISVTNTDPGRSVGLHLFFVDGATCSVADNFICLTPNQTSSFLASEIDPGTTGYIVMVASDLATGCPINFNHLIGDAYVKFSTGRAANLGAEAISAIAGGLPSCNLDSVSAQLNFDGVSYDRIPRMLALDNIPSRAEGNDTLLILNRIGGSLATGASTLTNVFGIFYNDVEDGVSFTFNPGVCQFRASITNNFPRITPRFEQFVQAGRSGWFKVYSSGDQGILGAAINFNPGVVSAAEAFNQGHNLHKLTTTSSASYIIPIFAPNC